VALLLTEGILHTCLVTAMLPPQMPAASLAERTPSQSSCSNAHGTPASLFPGHLYLQNMSIFAIVTLPILVISAIYYSLHCPQTHRRRQKNGFCFPTECRISESPLLGRTGSGPTLLDENQSLLSHADPV